MYDAYKMCSSLQETGHIVNIQSVEEQDIALNLVR